MSKIIEFISSFFTNIGDIFSAFGSIIRYLLSYIGIITPYVTGFFSVFPAWISITAVILLAVSIIYKILGREGNA